MLTPFKTGKVVSLADFDLAYVARPNWERLRFVWRGMGIFPT